MSGSRPNAKACVPNIGPAGQRRRIIGGAFWLAAGIVAAVMLARSGAGPGWRSLLVLPFMLAALGWFQARERT